MPQTSDLPSLVYCTQICTVHSKKCGNSDKNGQLATTILSVCVVLCCKGSDSLPEREGSSATSPR